MRELLAEVKYGTRRLWATPTFTAAVVATLAVGIAVTAAIFAFVNAVVLRPLPFPHAERLVTVCESYAGSTPDWCSISPPNVEDIRARSRSLEAIGIGRTWSYHLATADGQHAINAAIVTPGALSALGAHVIKGRLLQQGDLIGQPSTVALVSYESWQLRFGGAPDIVGRRLILDNLPVTIVGIMDSGFVLPRYESVELWRPIHLLPNNEDARDWRGFVAYGLLRKGTTLEQAQRELATIGAGLKQEHFASASAWGLSMQPLQELVVGSVQQTMFTLLGAAAVILLIGCVNVANLLLVRASARSREIAVRRALGASRSRVVRTFLVESALIGVAGSVVGLVLAQALTGAFKALAPSGIPRIESVSVDGPVIAFAMAIGMGASLVLGLVPALRAGRTDPGRSLREGGRGASRHAGRLGATLVVIELSLALMLVTASGLLVRTFAAYAGWTPGFDQDRLLVFNLSAPEATYPTGEQVAQLWMRVENELRAIPGIQFAGTASAGPLFGGDGSSAIRLEGAVTPDGASAQWSDVSPGWFGALGVPIVRGRDLAPTDRAGTPRVTLVNETFARRYWPGANPIGRRFVMADRDMPLEIVGVVRDVAPMKPGSHPVAEVYWSNRQLPRPYTNVIVRSRVEPSAIVPLVRARLSAIDRDLTPGSMRRYSEIVERNLARPRFSMLLLGAFGFAALLLSAVGVYGLLAYVVSMRRREMAIRLALGAERSQLLRGVLASGARLAVIGGVVGVVGALALGKVMSSMVSGISTRDPTSFAVATVILIATALVACIVPARRASAVDPAIALKAE